MVPHTRYQVLCSTWYGVLLFSSSQAPLSKYLLACRTLVHTYYEHRKIWVSGTDKICIITLLLYVKETTSTLLPDSEFANKKNLALNAFPYKLIVSAKKWFFSVFRKILFFPQTWPHTKNIQHLICYKKGYIHFCKRLSAPKNTQPPPSHQAVNLGQLDIINSTNIVKFPFFRPFFVLTWLSYLIIWRLCSM